MRTPAQQISQRGVAHIGNATVSILADEGDKHAVWLTLDGKRHQLTIGMPLCNAQSSAILAAEAIEIAFGLPVEAQQ